MVQGYDRQLLPEILFSLLFYIVIIDTMIFINNVIEAIQ